MDSILLPKSMSSLLLLSIFLLFFSATSDENLSAYQALQEYDFPVGILPQGIESYELDKATGAFTAYLNQTCSFSLENSYQLKYKNTIKGVISKDKIKNLNGVSVKVLLLWLNIVEVARDGDELQFSVGIASADFPVDNFFESPQCGCGFDCVSDGRVIKINHHLVSSS